MVNKRNISLLKCKETKWNRNETTHKFKSPIIEKRTNGAPEYLKESSRGYLNLLHKINNT